MILLLFYNCKAIYKQSITNHDDRNKQQSFFRRSLDRLDEMRKNWIYSTDTIMILLFCLFSTQCNRNHKFCTQSKTQPSRNT